MYKKRKTNRNTDRVSVVKLTVDTPKDIALKSMQYFLLDPKHPGHFNIMTYVDEVVLLCLLKDVDVHYSDSEGLYLIDGQDVSSSIDKLIERGYIDYATMKPNKQILKRVYITHPFADQTKFDTQAKSDVYIDYWIVEEFEYLRSKWKSGNSIITLYKGLKTMEAKGSKGSSRLTLTQLVNVAKHKPRQYTSKKVSVKFEHSLSLLHEITDVLFKDIQKLVME